MDYQALLYDPTYTVLGVPGVINGVEGFTVLDKTTGLDAKFAEGLEVQTITPLACVRARELQALGVTLDTLERGTLIMNGTEWRIDSYKLRASPNGQRDGEVALLLSEDHELTESESESESESE